MKKGLVQMSVKSIYEWNNGDLRSNFRQKIWTLERIRSWL
jgi:hypothetical protein